MMRKTHNDVHAPNGIGAPQCYHLSMPRVPERPRLTTERTVTASPSDIQAIVRADHSDPFAVLGPHRLKEGPVAVRAFLPFAETARVLPVGATAGPQAME